MKNTFATIIASLLAAQVLAFAPSTRPASLLARQNAPNSARMNAKKSNEDLSYIESRDMTREEMLELNAKNEEIMNMELNMMTGFSLVLSLPILYLCWVAFFSE
mmetsp:Transcript_18395/g.28670  ORF Transcript_18395/g.28670 Transcript_18395/m.28670 type:complete len:104 (-) Transcript_18395:323-634(-)